MSSVAASSLEAYVRDRPQCPPPLRVAHVGDGEGGGGPRQQFRVASHWPAHPSFRSCATFQPALDPHDVVHFGQYQFSSRTGVFRGHATRSVRAVRRWDAAVRRGESRWTATMVRGVALAAPQSARSATWTAARGRCASVPCIAAMALSARQKTSESIRQQALARA